MFSPESIPQFKDERVDYLRQNGFVLPSSKQGVLQHNATEFNPLQSGFQTFAPPQYDRGVDLQPNPRPYVPYANSVGDF